MSQAQTSEYSVFEERTRDGESYLVAPVVAVKEGVYLYPRANGRGIKREFLPAEEITNTADAWEGMPLTLSHPADEEDRPGLIDDPSTSQTVVGEFLNIVTNDDSLGGETWILMDEIGEHDGVLEDYVNHVERTGKGEVSTGYRADTRFNRGTHDGEHYSYVQQEPEPDHLALLVENVGNCSVEDGCGVGDKPNSLAPVARMNGFRANHRTVINVLSEARTPEYSGTETSSWGDVPKTLTHFADEVGAEYEGENATVAALSADERETIAEYTLLGDPDADTTRELMMFPVVNPASGALNEGALDAVLSGRGAEADIPSASLDSARSVAQRLLNEEFDRELDRENVEVPVDVKDFSTMGKAPKVHIGGPGYEGAQASDSWLGELREIREKVNRLLRGAPDEPDDGDTEEPEDGDTGTEDSGNEDNPMSEMKDALVNEHGLTEERAEELAGTECGEKILNAFNKAAEAEESTEAGDEGGEEEEPEEPTSEPSTGDELEQRFEQFESRLEEKESRIEELEARLEAEDAEKEAAVNEKLEEHTDLGEETLETMSLEAKENLADDLIDEEEEEDEDRANMAGVPGTVTHDYELEDDENEIPAGGRTNYDQFTEEQEGDD